MHLGREAKDELAAHLSTIEAEDSHDGSSIINKLYPELPKKELHTAEAILVRYCEIAICIAELERQSESPLTQSKQIPTIEERSNVDLKT